MTPPRSPAAHRIPPPNNPNPHFPHARTLAHDVHHVHLDDGAQGARRDQVRAGARREREPETASRRGDARTARRGEGRRASARSSRTLSTRRERDGTASETGRARETPARRERNTRERTDDGRNANATRTGTQDAGEELHGARREGGGRISRRVLRAGRVLGGARVDALRDVGRTVVRDVHDVPGGATIGQELGRGGVPEDGEAGSGGGPGGEG